jgi:hypothetical protein
MTIKEVNIVHTVMGEHGPIYQEMIELITECLQGSGVAVSCTANKVIDDRLNLFVGAVMFLPPEVFARIRAHPRGYIVFQTEALDSEHGFASRWPAYFEFLGGARQVWDYSQRNMRYLAERGLANVRYVPLGYSSRLERIPMAADTDIDILFYGSVTPRRRQILDELQQRGYNTVQLYSKYGPIRDAHIARAKIQLNVHQFETPHLEHLRHSYLLNNRCFIVSETSDENPYGDGVVFCDYKDIVDRCAYYLKPEMEAERIRIAQSGHEHLKRVPMASSLGKAIAEIRSG